MVELATVVYAKDAFVAQLAANQRMQKAKLSSAISLCDNGGSSSDWIDPCSKVASSLSSVAQGAAGPLKECEAGGKVWFESSGPI